MTRSSERSSCRALGRVAALVVLVAGTACGDDTTGTSGATSTTGTEATTAEATETAGTSATSAAASGSDAGSGGSTSGTSAGETTGTTGGATTADATTTGADATTTTTTTTGVECLGGGLGSGDHTLEIDHGGLTRTALLHIPPGYDDGVATPLVVNFHGLSSNAGQQVLFSGMNATADAEGFIVAYPEGVMNSWNAGECCGVAQEQGIDDVGFVRALVEAIEAEACVDPARIFATGMSNGGFMTNRLACEASDLFAAFAPVSAALVTIPCAPARAIPTMIFNGTQDALVPYDGGLFFGAQETFAFWVEASGCEGAPVTTYDEGAATCETFDSCDEGAAVTLCTIEPMGHCWPGNDFCPFPPANSDIAANDAMWAFFAAHPLP
jgi:polyhydroxybutyrate depolymerase